MAKPATGTYQPNKRVMLKVKHERECDCVVAGFRWHKTGPGELVGSLLLGLYDDDGTLHHVGVAASFTAAKRRELVKLLEPYRTNALANHPWKDWGGADASDSTAQRMPGAKSRWSQGKDLSWEPLRPDLVVEVAYDHMEGDRFRHTAHFRRWRPDKPPRECTYAQLEVVAPHELEKIFAVGRQRRFARATRAWDHRRGRAARAAGAALRARCAGSRARASTSTSARASSRRARPRPRASPRPRDGALSSARAPRARRPGSASSPP